MFWGQSVWRVPAGQRQHLRPLPILGPVQFWAPDCLKALSCLEDEVAQSKDWCGIPSRLLFMTSRIGGAREWAQEAIQDPQTSSQASDSRFS